MVEDIVVDMSSSSPKGSYAVGTSVVGEELPCSSSIGRESRLVSFPCAPTSKERRHLAKAGRCEKNEYKC